MTETEDFFGPAGNSAAVADVPLAAPAPSPSADWQANVKASIAAFRGVCENTRHTRGRTVLASWLDVLRSAVVVCRAACVCPMPGKFAKILPVAESLAGCLVERYEYANECEPGESVNVSGICAAVDLLAERLAVSDKPKRRESPRELAKLPNITVAQIVKMCPWLSAPEVESHLVDPLNNPLPEAPPDQSEPAPVTTLPYSMKQLLDRLAEVSGQADEIEINTEIERQNNIALEADSRIRQLESRRKKLSVAEAM